MRKNRREDLTGRKFGKLTVLQPAEEFEAEHGRPDEEYRQEPASRPWVAAEGDADVQG